MASTNTPALLSHLPSAQRTYYLARVHKGWNGTTCYTSILLSGIPTLINHPWYTSSNIGSDANIVPGLWCIFWVLGYVFKK